MRSSQDSTNTCSMLDCIAWEQVLCKQIHYWQVSMYMWVWEVVRILPMKQQPHEQFLVRHMSTQASHENTQVPWELLAKPYAH
jgi:hypothetical protein